MSQNRLKSNGNGSDSEPYLNGTLKSAGKEGHNNVELIYNPSFILNFKGHTRGGGGYNLMSIVPAC